MYLSTESSSQTLDLRARLAHAGHTIIPIMTSAKMYIHLQTTGTTPSTAKGVQEE